MRAAIESLISLLESDDPAQRAQGEVLACALPMTAAEAAFLVTARPWRGRNLGALPLAGARLSGCSLSRLRLTGTRLAGAILRDAVLADLDLSSADLTGADLQGATLTRCVLWGADLSDADLRGAVLERVSLAGAVLTGIDLRGALLRRCRLVGLSLPGLRARGLELSDTALRQCDLSGAALGRLRAEPGCDLRESRLVGADLSGADLRGCALSGAALSGADLSGADLTGADLRDADLTDAILTDTILTAADLRGATLPSTRHPRTRQCLLDDTLRPGADLRDWRLEHRDLSGATLSGAELSGADLTGADLTGADLTDARLVGAFLCEADLRGARLVGADLSDADLSGADLRGADLRRAQRWRVDARWALVDEHTEGTAGLIGTRRIGPGADLRGWCARRLDLSGVDLSGARLVGAWLAEVNLRGARLTGLVRRHRWIAPLRLFDADLRGALYEASDIEGVCIDAREGGEQDVSDLGLVLHAQPAPGFDPITGREGDSSVFAIAPGTGLRQALLSGADLSGADLSSADLSGADLTEADLCGADLSGADLSGAFLDGCGWDADTRWPGTPPPPARCLPRLRGAPWAGSVVEPPWLEAARWVPLWDGAHALRWDGRRWQRIRHRQTQRSRSRIHTPRGITSGVDVVVDLSHPDGRTGALVRLLVALAGAAPGDLLLSAVVERPEGEPWGIWLSRTAMQPLCLFSAPLEGVTDPLHALAWLWRHFVESAEDGERHRVAVSGLHHLGHGGYVGDTQQDRSLLAKWQDWREDVLQEHAEALRRLRVLERLGVSISLFSG